MSPELADQLRASYPALLSPIGVLTEGGHRRVRVSAVQAYLATRTNQQKGAVSLREAAIEAGLYDHPDGRFAQVRRGVTAAKKAAPAKTPRKPRSRCPMN